MGDALNGKSIEQDCFPSYGDTLHEYRWTLNEVPGLAHNRASPAVDPEFTFNQTLPFLARRDEKGIRCRAGDLHGAMVTEFVICKRNGHRVRWCFDGLRVRGQVT